MSFDFPRAQKTSDVNCQSVPSPEFHHMESNHIDELLHLLMYVLTFSVHICMQEFMKASSFRPDSLNLIIASTTRGD
jgi:hypothetical protein